MLATLKIPYEEISNACEISTEMFLQKLNGQASFTIHEAQTIKMFINSKINIDYLFKEQINDEFNL